MNISKAFGKRLKAARNHAKLSQPELAKACGWDSQSRLSNYERGERTPSLDDIDKLAKALNTSICTLISKEYKSEIYQVKENSGCYKTDPIDKEIKEVVEYTLNNQLKMHFKNLSLNKQVSIVFELYTSLHNDRALLKAAKEMQPNNLLKMVKN